MNRPALLFAAGALLLTSGGVVAQRASTPSSAAADQKAATAAIVSAANAVLSSLDADGRAKGQFAFNDDAQRKRWSNLPGPMFVRQGMRLGDLTPAQRTAVMKLLQTAFSPDGYRKVTEIMRGDEVLKTTGGGPRRSRRPGRRPEFRRRRVLPGVSRHALDDRAVDAAVRRSSPRDQPDVGRQPGDA